MSTENSETPNAPTQPQAAPPVPATPAAPEAQAEAVPHAQHAPATEPAAPNASNGDDAGEEEAGGDDAGDEAAGDAASPAEGGAPGAAAAVAGGGVPGAPGTGKRKRRRRKKKKPGMPGEAGAAGQASGEAGGEHGPREHGEQGPREEGAHAEGGEHAEGGRGRPQQHQGPGGQRNKNPRPPRESRERPAFGVGDVVFGKIIEILDEALIVDLSGKAKAIFDRQELTIPDEPANTPVAEVDEDAPGAPVIPAALRDKDEVVSPEANTAVHATVIPVEGAAPPGEAVPDAPAEAAAAEPIEPAAVTAEGTAEGAADADDDDDKDPPQPEEPAYLPPVVMEVGASFVGVVHNDGARGGLVVITRHPRRASRAKPKVFEAFKNAEKETVMGLVTGVIKGGVEVDIDGLRAFAPGSHVDTRLGADLHYMVGKRLNFVVTQYGKKGRDVVLSRRKFIEVESKAARIQALAKLDIGGEIEGIVRSIVPFGAFVDVGGIEGLIPLAEMSHNRSDTPHDIFTVGEPTMVKIVKVDEKGKVWLSRRATIADPWTLAVQKYAVHTKHKGKVVRLQPFGAFIELEPGIDGLIHASDLSVKRIEHPSEVVKVNDEIDVVVSHVDVGAHKIALHPAPTGEAEGETPQKVVMHKSVKVKVVNIEQNGLVVRVMGATGRNARGYIPAGGTGTQRGTELRKVFKEGQEIDAKVIDIDPKRGEVKLSIRALNEDSERNAYKSYQAQVKKEAKFTFGDLLAKKLQK
jgi:small subunit ribosomal protein S1